MSCPQPARVPADVAGIVVYPEWVPAHLGVLDNGRALVWSSPHLSKTLHFLRPAPAIQLGEVSYAVQ